MSSSINLFPKFGVEVHACVTSSKLKLMSRAENSDDLGNPNAHVDLVDVGMPGSLPVLNNEVVIHSIRAAIALNMCINESFWFDRKSYFYPDLPLGYQITQFFKPLGVNGYLTLPKKIRIREMHLETDAGKSMHEDNKTLLDYNRSGCPLLEIVTEPDLRDTNEIIFFLRMMRATLRHVEVCDGSMERGNFRVDLSVSVGPGNDLGTRVEIKNLSSDRAIRNAAEYEVKRQIDMIQRGEKVQQETRLFSEKDRKTVFMRIKENPSDYMYAPDPDLPRFCIDPRLIESERGRITSLPEDIFKNMRDNFGLKETEAMSIVENPHVTRFLDRAFQGKKMDLKIQMVKLMLGEVFSRLGNEVMRPDSEKIEENNREVVSERREKGDKRSEEVPISVEDFQKLSLFILQKKPNSMLIKEVMNKLWDGDDIDKLIKENDQVEDTGVIKEYLDAVMKENPSEVERFIAGEVKLKGFFIGEVMKKGGNKIPARAISAVLEELMSER